MTTPTPDPLADPVTVDAYDALVNAERRSIFVVCPECADYVVDAFLPCRTHAATCAPLRAEASHD